MTNPQPLLEVHGPSPLLMLEATLKAAAEAAWGWQEAGLTVRVVRGRKMRTVDDLFDEFAAALQFPYYFGENWPAFDECLSDMDWLPTSVGIVVVIVDPAEVLADEPEVELGVLVRLITHAADTYSEPIDAGEWWDRPALPFHVVLHSSAEDVAVVLGRWQAAGATVSAWQA